MGWSAFLLTYLLGGITFLPLLVIVVFAHAYLYLPYRQDADLAQTEPGDKDDLVQTGDDLEPLKATQKDGIKLRTVQHEQDVAAGYFAVCREYTPMGINAKPIERATPVGSTTVAAPSPSVYQTMYRSIFDRKQNQGPLDAKNGANQRPKKAGNVFYVVLRHGHLMLFDDDEQLEVRHVVSLAHHDVSIYSGEPVTPEGELWIKRNAICLSRRTNGPELSPDSQLSKPFYLFSENCSAKEDFYFALLRNQEQTGTAGNKAPTPIQFGMENMISLVQKLHASEEHMQTRWLNAMIGRVFLGVHKTKDIENFIREKLTKKISRVKRPAFLSHVAIKAIDTGDSAPYITNPRLKDLTVEGECGHALFKIKPPPSNRIWFSFQQMPKIEMTIEPIVSSRQITYTVILRQIENRIKEVIAETIVLPFWDDTPFFNTEHKVWRGGVFHDDAVKSPASPESAAAQEGDLGEVERLEETHGIQETELPPIEKSHTMPVLDKKPSVGLFGKKLSSKASKADLPSSPSTSSTSTETKNETKNEVKHEAKNEVKSEAKSDIGSPPPVLSAPFAQPSSPTVGTIATNADQFRPSSSPPSGDSAASAMATLSATSHTPSPAQTPNPNAFKPYITSKSSNLSSSSSSKDATDTEKDADKTPQVRRNTVSSTESHSDGGSHSPTLSTKGSVRGQTGTISRGFFSRRDTTSSVSSGISTSDSQKRTTLNAVANAAASAKRWGFNAFQRRPNDEAATHVNHSDESAPALDLSQPMGRGHPLPPPGTPLPMPEKKTSTAPIQVPKRKPIPPPSTENHAEHTKRASERRPVPPPLPKRRQPQNEDGEEHGMLVVTAPAESEPTTPSSASNSPSYPPPQVDEVEASGTSPLKTEEPTKADVVGLGVSLPEGASVTKGDQLDVAAGVPGSAAEDEDYSAWMDNAELEESALVTTTQAA
ncbi:hypothetical protein CHGG_06596 [Chaetomium globosum CBS 148.51]|uniref:SMP-LTD domain-containing protein n=1 Tax=Chaetomium globosum (strain ATCC 6205 / CBS 148.51 / DSM 1962 / NBRC 6347 / NRRL 1970) TaxID=306901 RepID=Q2H419_CHAGB|nr:uncharacterized protein CHGG_06596 [Chaetomium globosum CBS 148.51]EAQ89977.1 hypothetical protein CHGG_06596 [Chaetomium globosum CBS 148.51]